MKSVTDPLKKKHLVNQIKYFTAITVAKNKGHTMHIYISVLPLKDADSDLSQLDGETMLFTFRHDHKVAPQDSFYSLPTAFKYGRCCSYSKILWFVTDIFYVHTYCAVFAEHLQIVCEQTPHFTVFMLP